MFIVKDANIVIEPLDDQHAILFIKDPASMTHVEYTPLRESKTIITHAAFKRCYERASSYLAMENPACLLVIYDQAQYPIKASTGSTTLLHEDGFVSMCYVHQYAYHQLAYSNEHDFIEVFENIRNIYQNNPRNFADIVATKEHIFSNPHNIIKDGSIRGLLSKYKPLVDAVDNFDADAFHQAYNQLLEKYSNIFTFQEPPASDFYAGIKTLYKLLDAYLKTNKLPLDRAVNDEGLRTYLTNVRGVDRRSKAFFFSLLADRKVFMEFYKAVVLQPSPVAMVQFVCAPENMQSILLQKVLALDPFQQAQKMGFYYMVVSTNFNTLDDSTWKSLGFVRSRNGGDTLIHQEYNKRVLDGEVEIISRPRQIIHTVSRKIDPVLPSSTRTPRGGRRR